MQALATACVSGPEQTEEEEQVTARVMDQLVKLVNPENSLEHIGASGPVRHLHTLLYLLLFCCLLSLVD